MGFRSPILGGSVLLRPAIQSPNYAAQSAGWTVRADGSAEFNNITIRGGSTVDSTALYYNGVPATGNLVASVSAAAGTDGYGNAYLAGVCSYATGGLLSQVISGEVVLQDQNGRQVILNASQAAGTGLSFLPAGAAGVWTAGSLLTATELGSHGRPYAFLQSPTDQINHLVATLELIGSESTKPTTAAILTAALITLNGPVSSPNVASFGGIRTPLVAQKANPTTVSSANSGTTLVNDSELFIPVEANATYKLVGFLEFTGPTIAQGTGDLKLDVTVPTGSTFRWTHLGAVSGSPNSMDSVAMANGTTRVLGTFGTSTDLAAVVLGRLTTGASAGNLQLQLAQSVANAIGTTLQAGSWLDLVRTA